MNFPYRLCPAAISLAILSLAFGHGCGSARRFDESIARQRLKTLLPEFAEDIEILSYGDFGDETRSEYWVLFGKTMPEPGASAPRRRSEFRATAFPSDAVLSFAAAVGVTDDRLAASRQPSGQLWEWDADGSTVRLRTVETDEGFLSVVELLP